MFFESLQRPQVREFAENAAGRGTRVEQARRLFLTLRNVVRYYGDPMVAGDFLGLEQTKAPWVLIDEIKARGFTGGDCDDQATLNYTLLKIIGIPAMLRVGWYGQINPQHIYAVAKLDGEWTAFDTTGDYMGKERAAVRILDFI